MPESRLRKKRTFTAPEARSGALRPSPRWFAPTMCAMLVIGLVWVVTYYITQGDYPIPGIHTWNLVAGFGILLVGFGLLTRWR